MKKIKILIVAAGLKIGGAEKIARDIAWYADPQKYEFHYVVFGNEIGAYEQELQEKGCRIFHLPEPSDSYRVYWKNLCSLMRQYRYDVVHAHNMFNCGWIMLAARHFGVPIRITHAHSALKDGGGLVKSVYEFTMRQAILRCSTDLVACGRDAGIRLFGQKAFEKRGNLILNGIDTQAFAYDPEKRQAIRSQLQLKDRLVIGHVGHLAQVKNQRFLLELMPDILKRRPDAMLLLLGEGEDRPMLEQRIRELGLSGHVILTGNVNNVPDYLSAMDVFTFPSLYEGLPLSLLEVQANGLPCVISDQVPRDVYVTDLVRPLSLQAPGEQWIQAILGAQRRSPERYRDQVYHAGYSVEGTMNKIYRIYEQRGKL